jgi:putative isomerase
MLRHATITPDRAWYTWSSRPAEMVFLPLGVRLTPLAFAGSTGRATLFPPGPGVRFGSHDLAATQLDLKLEHAGTVLDWSYHKPDPFRVVGRWRARTLGEWGLRFWINLCLSAEGGSAVTYDPATGAATIKVGHRFVALVAAEPPVQVTGHASVEALAAEYEAHGYFYLASRATAAPVLALRFNLEMTRDGAFALAVADRADLAVEQAKTALAEPSKSRASAHTGRFAGALDAVRDVMAWNNVWDEINTRPYTSISRNWNQSKFGGFGVWLNDQLYAALLGGMLDPEVQRENLACALAGATPQGNLACLATANDAWVDRTQLPIGAFLVRLMGLRSGSRAAARLAYGILARNHAWWWRERDPGRRGLCSYGTSDVGEGLYKGTSFGARNESSMDNAPIHDEAPYDPATRTLASLDVGLNSLLALDAEMLAAVAADLGLAAEAAAYAARAAATRDRVRAELWDEARGLFANRLWSGDFVRSLGPTSFYPLVAGIPTPAQTERMLVHLRDPASFGGPFPIPGTARDDPAARDNVYWRGRIWPPMNWFVWQGLRRAGKRAEASDLARRSFALFRSAWDERRICAENYNAETGEPLDGPDTDGFYGWGALMPAMAVGEVMDHTPWGGWEIVNTGEDLTLGPVESPVGPATLTVAGGVLTLMKGETPMLVTDLAGRLSGLRFAEGLFVVMLPDAVAPGCRLTLPGIAADAVLLARIGEREAAWSAGPRGVTLTDLGAADAGSVVRIVWSSEMNRKG